MGGGENVERGVRKGGQKGVQKQSKTKVGRKECTWRRVFLSLVATAGEPFPGVRLFLPPLDFKGEFFRPF